MPVRLSVAGGPSDSEALRAVHADGLGDGDTASYGNAREKEKQQDGEQAQQDVAIATVAFGTLHGRRAPVVVGTGSTQRAFVSLTATSHQIRMPEIEEARTSLHRAAL